MAYTLQLLDQANHHAILDRIHSINPQYVSTDINNDRATLLQLVVNANNLASEDLKYVRSPQFYNLYRLPYSQLLAEASKYLPFSIDISRSDLIKMLLDRLPLRKKVLVVGAGPVGLIFAILMHQDPRLRELYEVTLLEKRPAYTRSTVLLISPTTYNLLPNAVKRDIWEERPRKGCYILSPNKDNLARCYENKLPLASVPIKTLEKSLFKYATDIGINIMRPTDRSFDINITPTSISVNDQPLDFDIVVGADGYSSRVRSEMLQSDVSSKIKPSYAFIATGELPLEQLKGIFKKASLNRIQTVESRSPQNEYRFFRTPTGSYYVGLLLNKEQYDSIVNSQIYPSWLTDKIKDICKMVGVKGCFEVTPDNSTIFPVSPTFSNLFSRTEPFPVYLIGDALANTNFFTGSGVNIGVATALELTHLLGSYSNGVIPVDIYRRAQQANVKALLTGAASIVQQEDFNGELRV